MAALSNAIPPPGKIPSSNAALVACKASSTLSFFSFISISVWPPTCTIATPPINLANLFCKFSFSNGEVDSSIWVLIESTLWVIFSSSPFASIIVVVSLEIVALLAFPNQAESNLSNLIPFSDETTCPPVNTAISSNIAFFLSPNSGALTAAQAKIPLILFTTNVDKASPSISSAITNNDLFCWETASKIGSNSLTCWILLSTIKT